MRKGKLDEFSRQEFLAQQEQIDSKIKEIGDLNLFCVETFKDHGELIKSSDEQKERYEEENEKIRIENSKIQNQIKEVERANDEELQVSK